jgi:hypothetical protein
MSERDRDYFRRRAAEEREAAALASSPAASAIHENIARHYEMMAEQAAHRPVLTPHYGTSRRPPKCGAADINCRPVPDPKPQMSVRPVRDERLSS